MRGRDMTLWNIACDAAINAINPYPLPGNGVPPVKNKNAELIYRDLQGQQKKQGQGQGQGQGQPQQGQGQGQDQGPPNHGCGEVRQAPADLTPEEIRQVISQAASYAKAQGKLPGHIARDLKMATQAQVPWQTYIHRFLQELAPTDYSWLRPDPEFVAYGTYVPILEGTCIGPLAIAIDTSGSIGGPTLAQFAKEVAEAMAVLQPRITRVLWCDAAVHDIHEFDAQEPFELRKVKGGGGTDFRPVFRNLEKWDEPPVGLIYLTDTYGGFPDHPPEYPVLWVIEGQGEVPWGETARILD
jgi:predicted metal-dependent peptidase